jgi:serine/threonine-protein kinase
VIGTTLADRYRIERLIGEGGMGAVFEATQLDTGRRVAVKVISTGDLAKTAEIRARFAREATAVAALDTRNIVQVLESGTDAQTGLPFMAMELLTGADLQVVLERLGALPEHLALRIVAQACIGLQRAHEAGVVHRDVKPANLFLANAAIRTRGTEIVVKLLDFGIAKVKMDELGNTAQGLTRTGNMLGTPLFMSPEQAKGLKSIDGRTDVWSLGAVLYQAVSGAPPHEEETVGQLILAICSEPVRPVQEIAPWVSPETAAIVHRALRIDPADRYQSAAELLTDVGAVLEGSWSISPEMIVPLPEEQRAQVARRVVVSDKRHISNRDSMQEAGVASTTVFDTTGRGRSLLPRSLRRRGAAAVLGVVAVGGALGLAAWLSLRARPSSADLPASPGPAAAAPPPSAAATEAAPSPAITPASPVPATVRVAVPGATKVTVDGVEVNIVDGAIEVAGALGKRYTVRVMSGTRHAEQEVAVTEAGAFPDRIELGKKPVAAAPLKPSAAPAAPPSAAPAAPAHATKFE